MEALIVQNDEAASLARELAERRGTSVDEAVVESLRVALAQTPPREPAAPGPVRQPSLDELTSQQRASASIQTEASAESGKIDARTMI